MNKASKIYALLVTITLLASALVGCTTHTEEPAATRTITDMLGRTVEIPAEVDTVLGTSPTTTLPIYMLAPDSLAGWSFELTEDEAHYIPSKYQGLPVVGGWFGTQSGNYETFILINPDVVFEGFTSDTDTPSIIDERQQKLGEIPVVVVEETIDPTAWSEAISFLGSVLGKEEKAAELISYYNEAMDYVTTRAAQIPENEKRRVYYAEGPHGLETEPAGSERTKLIELCGGINIAEGPLNNGYGRIEVSIEQVLLWNPDVIIAGDPVFYKEVFSDTKWQNIKAIKNQEVYLVPHGPFSWFDRPAGINQIIGIYWMAKTLYPERLSELNLESKAREFFSKFYHYDLTSEEFSRLVNPE
jgi:iron complex transport system substrate-binding protein